ncbi:MAG: molecular chaperone HtpG [Fibrobacteria bacterium]|nr:molecular chaperone HtpG [Fibrobacteria bacterium]
MSDTVAPEKIEFQAEVKQILNLVINSLYSNKEICIREVVSNASDAIDKARIESLTNIEVLGDDHNFKIKIDLDKDKNQIIISDNGIGMSKEEVVSNIGTIARSGTQNFLKELSGDQKKDTTLIGQFGVGFYSTFMIADKVEIKTKRLGSDEPATKWESQGDGSYTLEETDKESRGTDIILHLKEEDKDFCDDWKIRSIIKKYSSFMPHPIVMDKETEVDKKKVVEEEVLNDKPPIWLRQKTDIKKEEYQDFFKHLSMETEDALAYAHNHVEGTLEYKSLFYIPSKAPYDLYHPEKTNGLSLYVKRIFIMNDCKELLPNYLRFVKGVVDSEDLPLNISREILQQNNILTKIQKASTKKILNMLKSMATKKPDDYKKFWKEFGNVIKEGFHMNWENLDELKQLVRFQSSTGSSEDDIRSLADYVKDMKKDQKEIYYITGENRQAVDNSPHLEVFKSKEIEVLYMVDPIDEWILQGMGDFDGKQLKSVTKGDLDLGELSKEEKAAQKEGKSKFKKLSKFISDSFPNMLKEVRVTTRLKDSPCCLVADEADMGANMERILKMTNQAVQKSKRILEINPEHPILQNMQARYDKDAKDPKLQEWTGLLIDQALLAEGSEIENPVEFIKKINGLLQEVSAK